MKTIILLPIIIGISLHSYARELDNPKTNYATPVANAGADKTIYLTETNTVALDGSASSADSYRWTEVSTDYSSGGIITSPTSKTTTVSGLPQGVFYFQIAATTGSTTKYDTMVVRVDYAQPPVNGTLLHSFNLSDPNALAVINNRNNTTNFYPVSDHNYGQFDDKQNPSWRYYLFRDRSNGLEIDNQKGKLISTIQDGYISNDGYPRAEIGISGSVFTIDTNHIYTFEYKGYFPQNVNYLTSWYEILTMFQIHSSAQVATVFGFNMDAKGDIIGQDAYERGSGVAPDYFTLANLSDFYRSAHTIRFTIKEGAGYPGQDAFIQVKLDGNTIYTRTKGQVGSTYYDDYIKFGGIYDWHSQMCSGDQLSRGRKWQLVTESFKVYTVSDTLESKANSMPTANAGDDQTITLPINTVQLSGSGADSDGSVASYHWEQISGPSAATLSSPNSATARASDLAEGTYQFQLTVYDNKGATGKDIMKAIVKPDLNMPPVADVGEDRIIDLPKNSIVLPGSGTSNGGTIVSYEWKQLSGPSAGRITDPDSAKAGVWDLIAGTYQFQLTVKDNQGLTGSKILNVVVNPAANTVPTVNAGNDQTIKLPTNAVTLSGSGSDEDGTIASYAWTKVAGPSSFTIADQKSATTKISNLSEGTYQFELKVTDNKGAIAKDTVQVKVTEAENIAPTANAGNNQTIKLPTNSVTLTGSGTDEDGTIASYAWTKIAGPNSGTINNANSSSATVNNLSEGTYQFELKVTDNKGAIAKDTVQVKVTEAENIAPTANAGNNQTIKLPTNAATLSGSGTDEDGSIASYQWTKIAGPSSFTIADEKSATTKISNLSEGTYQFELKVTDNKGAIAKDTVQVKVTEAENIAPTANAGNNQTIKLPTNSVTLIGSGTDADGTIASYQWTKVAGPNSGTINNANSSSATVNNLSEGTYQFELKVTDNKEAIAKDTVQVKVTEAENIAPTVNVGNDQTVKLPTNSVTLTGSGTDEDGTIASYAWTKVAGPNSGTINNANSSSATVNNLSEGTYQFELKVTDNKGAIAKDTVQVKVTEAENIAPTANAGNNQTIKLPTNAATLSGSGTDEDGTIASYAWTKVAGPSSFTIADQKSATTKISNLSEGTYQFELKVTDNKGAIARDTVQVKVTEAENIAPTANAGNNQTIKLPTNSVTLTGSGTDEDGTIASYQWTKISGPSSFTIVNSSSAITTVSGLQQGVYQFELKVIDNKGAIGRDTLKISVNAPNNVAPTANAGADKIITLPVNSVILSGTGSDSDGHISAYSWTKISGPSSFSIKNSSSATSQISGLVKGVYQFEFKVTDNRGDIGKDTIQVTVRAAENIRPTATAGSNQTITLPTNTITLHGSGEDSDGTITAYLWTKISGPSTFDIANAGVPVATVSNLVEGSYQFELKVTDNNGTVAKDTVQVTVNKSNLTATPPAVPANATPVANAGNNQTITFPATSVTLSGSGTDKDGTIASYQWTKISGPGSGTINNANSSSATVSNLSEGTYQFELKVTDDQGAIGKDTVNVTVNEAANVAPVANAGKDTTILYPASTVLLNGQGIDVDGEVASYKWKQISGPSQSIIKSDNTISPEMSELKEGTYEYELEVTDSKGAIGKDSVKVTVALGRVAPEINNSITVYPNPVHDVTTADINTGRANTNVLITISDMSGKTFYQKQVVSISDNIKVPIDMSNFGKGTYVITIFFDNVMRKSIKVVKL